MLKPHIIILGGGFGGTYVAKKLASLVKRGEIDVTIVNKTNYFLFTPLLHEVATGSLTPTSVAEPLREIFRDSGIELCQGEVEYINMKDRRVQVLGNGKKHTLVYDYLVIATGSETNYYNIPGADKFTLPLKNLSDAYKIRSSIIDAFEEAIFCENPADRMQALSFAIVGGGPTGVELAAEMSDFIKGLVNNYYDKTNHGGIATKCKPEEPVISIVDGGQDLLPNFPKSLREKSLERLEKIGVCVHLGNSVTAVTPRGLLLKNNMTIPASTIIWTAGVRPVVPSFGDEEIVLNDGRISSDQYMRLSGSDRVFVIGDVASQEAKPSPMLAQAAVRQSKIVARNLIASVRGNKLKIFNYRSKGSLVSVGQWYAVGEVLKVNISGRLTWCLWRTVYLLKFASPKKRIRILFEWLLGTFYTRDITKLT